MTKYKLTKPLNTEEIGLLLTIINFEIVGIDVTIDNLKRTTSDSKDEIQKIINQLIEKEYIEEI